MMTQHGWSVKREQRRSEGGRIMCELQRGQKCVSEEARPDVARIRRRYRGVSESECADV
jgi:hypothetical protein